MRKLLILLLCASFMAGLFGCGKKEVEKTDSDEPTNKTEVVDNNDKNENPVKEEKKTLVVYFSATGNTKKLAQYAIENYGADEFEIVPVKLYTSEDLNYSNSNSRSSQEMNDKNCRPEIANKVENMGDYDIIVLGYPIWWGQAPRIITTFLEGYDFSGKTIIPFCTSASSDIGSSDTNLHSCVSSDANWKSGKRFSSSTGKDAFIKWLDDTMNK